MSPPPQSVEVSGPEQQDDRRLLVGACLVAHYYKENATNVIKLRQQA